ncbi:MAG: M16 family metallopeptidase, partial [Acidimicrobiales bacterium]
DVRRTTLPNGVRVLTDSVPHAQSVALSVWVGVGSRDEPEAVAGASHFLEHLLFKGTETLSAQELSIAVDSVGGEMNAFTANEHTTYFARVPAGELDLGAELLLDVVEAPALRDPDFESERDVILEELAAAADDPDDVASVALFEALFPGHPLGREVLGTEESIASLRRDSVAAFFDTWYRPASLVVVAAGRVTHDSVVEAVGSRFGSVVGPTPERSAPTDDVVELTSLTRPVESVHLALGWRGVSASDDDRHALAVLHHVVGGGPSSRLFQEAREQRGLTYSIVSALSHNVDCGALTVHAATSTSKAGELMTVVDGVVGELAANGVTEGELDRAKRSIRGGCAIGYEDVGARMMRLGSDEVMRGTIDPVADELEQLDRVSAVDVARVARRVLGSPRSLAVVGPPGLPRSLQA